MIVLSVICRAPIHESLDARDAGCVCPVEWGRRYRPAATKPQRPYVKGRLHNRRGPHRSTTPEPDWAAVERALAGDRTLVLAKADRDEAIDRLDRQGLSAGQIAVRLALTARTVQRRRAERKRSKVNHSQAALSYVYR